MGGVYIWCEIVCAHCANTIGGRHVSGNRIPKREMLKEIKKYGWIIDGQGAFCNEQCHKVYKDEK